MAASFLDLPATLPETPVAGACQFCGCTDERACPGGCEWADATRLVCSRCADAVLIAAVWLAAAAELAAPVSAVLASRVLREQRLVVMVTRTLMEMAADRLAPDTEVITTEMRTLVAALEERFPDVLADLAERPRSLAEVVLDLIETGGRKVSLA